MNRGKFELIVTIVNKNTSKTILQASKQAGAEGGTVVYGRGTGIRETQTLLGIPIEEHIFMVVVPAMVVGTHESLRKLRDQPEQE